MKNRLLAVMSSCIFLSWSAAQSYTYTFVGDTSDVSTTTQFGICMMGGATEDDNGAEWFLNRAGGGNIVVIRASGGSGYNNYFFSDLGVTVQSVETIVFNNATAANDPFVLRRLENAEAIWIAGGDQYLYESYWKNSPVKTILNNHVNIKQAPIGGTSAGMAILGGHYYNAANGSITSAQALGNPYHSFLTIETDFLTLPYLSHTITDTHYNNPDRKGRHSTFIARAANDNSGDFFGIAADEYVAICIDENGTATVFGDYPNYMDYAYFIRMNCAADLPETITSGEPLTWIADNNALFVYRANATSNGATTFNLTTWNEGTGGTWFNWTIDNGNLQENSAIAPACALGLDTVQDLAFSVYPNPATSVLHIDYSGTLLGARLLNAQGKIVAETTTSVLHLDSIAPGNYSVHISTDKGNAVKNVIVGAKN
jgi:cyanophycinase-like exopeptidase